MFAKKDINDSSTLRAIFKGYDKQVKRQEQIKKIKRRLLWRTVRLLPVMERLKDLLTRLTWLRTEIDGLNTHTHTHMFTQICSNKYRLSSSERVVGLNILLNSCYVQYPTLYTYVLHRQSVFMINKVINTAYYNNLSIFSNTVRRLNN